MDHQRLQALESKLKAQLKFKHPDEKVVKPIRRELQDRYVRIVLCDGQLAARVGAEGSLWKLCFYKRIDEFRRALAKSHEQISDPAKSVAAEQVLAATTREFSRFLDKSAAFYLAFLQRAAVGCRLALPGYERSPQAPWPPCLETGESNEKISSEQRQSLVATCYRCLIYLGDLERYRGSCQREISAHDWTAAEQHYSTALLLRPYSGNPHNQCGVIANYRGDDLSGFYHYFRAILCDDPYLPQARANLEMICRKNRDIALTDTASNSQQRRRVAQDASLRGLVAGRCFVRPLCLISLFSSLEDVTSAQNDVIVNLPAWLDADSPPSGLSIRMVSACIFTVCDLERQVHEASQHMDRSDENQNGNKPTDLAHLRDSYQHALDFTFRVASCMMHSGKSSHHHMEAVSVVCLWLLEHPHLVSPQKQVDKVFYDSERIRRAQQTFTEGLVDLINLLTPSLVKSQQDPADCSALPEDLLLIGCTPFHGCLDVLRHKHQQEQGPREILIGVDVVKDQDVLLKRRFERATALARVLSEAPGPILSVNPNSGELSVEGYKGGRKRSKQICAITTAGMAATASPVALPVGSSSSASVLAASELESLLPHGGVDLQLCNECGAKGRSGRVDEYDGLFYCDACWSSLDAPECNDDHQGHLSKAAAYKSEEGPVSVSRDTQVEAHGMCTENEAHGNVWEDDEEAFGSRSLPVDGEGVLSSLGDLAQQTAMFAAAASAKFDICRPSQHSQNQGVPSLSANCNRPQGSEEADYGYLEHLVQRTVDGELIDRQDARVLGSLVCAEEEEEQIVFRPRSQVEVDGGSSARWAAVDAMQSDAGAQGAAEGVSQSGEPFAAGLQLAPAQSSLWGGFGAGAYGFGASEQRSLALSNALLHPRAPTSEMAQSDLASRFSTRNPFAH